MAKPCATSTPGCYGSSSSWTVQFRRLVQGAVGKALGSIQEIRGPTSRQVAPPAVASPQRCGKW